MEVGTLQERVTVRGGGDDVPIGAPVGTRISQSAVADAPPACTPAAGQLTPPMKIRDVRPVYRRELVEARVEGDILMRAKIGKDGKVTSVDVISPLNADLEDAAIAAVTQWQFTPTYLNCEPIEVQMYVTVSFKIDR
jgi:protein TonB